MKKALFILLLAGLLTGIIAAYLMWNKPHRDMHKQKADFEITAEQLLVDYERNEEQANQQYLGKIIAVSGTIAQIEDGERKTILLATSNGIFGVRCELDPLSKEPLPDFMAGDAVTLKGTCTGYLGDVVLSRAVPVR
jgi:hypothetical protein